MEGYEEICGSEPLQLKIQMSTISGPQVEVNCLYRDWIEFCSQCLPVQPWNNKTKKADEVEDLTLESCSPVSENSTKFYDNECKVCGHTFKNSRGLKQHIGKVHEKDNKSWKCNCGRMFKDKYALKTHHEQVHKGMHRVVCPVCKKLIYNKYVLKKHLVAVHY